MQCSKNGGSIRSFVRTGSRRLLAVLGLSHPGGPNFQCHAARPTAGLARGHADAFVLAHPRLSASSVALVGLAICASCARSLPTLVTDVAHHGYYSSRRSQQRRWALTISARSFPCSRR